jgi:hypothetical protein
MSDSRQRGKPAPGNLWERLQRGVEEARRREGLDDPVPLLPASPQAERPPEPEPCDIAMVFRPRRSKVPVHVRERRLRKYALRQCEFDCLGATDIAPRKAQDERSGHGTGQGGG